MKSRTHRDGHSFRDGLARVKRQGRIRPNIEGLEARTLLAANPVASLLVPTQALVGEPLNFSVGFVDGSATDAGYGPYVDLFLATRGADGATAAPNDGIAFSSATYLGATVTSIVLTFDAFGNATHPYAKNNLGNAVVVAGSPGDSLVVLQLPFGSFTPGQPTATIQVSTSLSNLADVGTALNISARGGFRYGNDALDNPTTDPTLVGSTITSAVDPTLMLLRTTYIGPENETATGPNFPRQYLVAVDIATGQTLTNLDVIDALPANMQFMSVDATTIRGTPTATSAVATPSAITPGGTAIRRFASVTGTAAANDATLLFTFYIPQFDSNSTVILNPSTGAPTTSIDDAKAQGSWTPIDPRDSKTTVTSDATASDHTLTDRSLATQKSVRVATDTGAAGPTPGDTLEYTILVQVSDYFAFRNLVLSDLISDGQHFDPSFSPTLQVSGNPFVLSASGLNPLNYTVSQNFTGAVASAPAYTIDPAANDGRSTIAFRISDEMIARGEDGNLIGGLVPSGGGSIQSAPGDGPTTATLVFRTVILEEFTDDFPSGEPNVDHGDILRDDVTIAGDVLANVDLSPTGFTVTDTSAASVQIVAGTLTHSIYAINGNTSFTNPATIAAGDTVTYRLTYTLPTSDEEGLSLVDFVPLPIFDATTITAFDDIGQLGGTATIPAVGHANFGSSDTFRSLSGLVPTLSQNASANSVAFHYSNYQNPANSSSTIDLLFTIRAGSQPFADGLFLTSQARVVEGSTNAGQNIQDQIIQVKLTEPLLTITKGIVTTNDVNAVLTPTTVGPVAFSAPGSAGYRGSATITSSGLTSSPINSNATRIDAGDLVTFAVVIDNRGTGLNGAFDIRLRDTLPAGFAIPAGGLNLSVTDGTGAAISVTTIGTGLFDAAGGLELDDPGPTSSPGGAIDPYSASSGRNLMILTYDLEATSAVTPNQTLTNTATLFHYATTEGGPDFTTADLSEIATAQIATPSLAKALTATNQAFTSGSNLAIGEVATYTVTITVPEGSMPGSTLVDTLPSGLAIVGLDSITPSGALSTTIVGGFATVLSGATVGSGGSTATFDFGTLTNSDRDNAAAETITVVYRVVALNVAGNSNGATVTNSARLAYTGGSKTATAVATIATPLLQLVKSASTPTADAGDTITYTLVLSHASGSGADSFDVSLSDILPAGLSYVAGSLANTAGLAPTTLSESSGTLTAAYSSFARTSTSTLTFQATVGGGASAFQTITNTANVTYTTLSGSPAATSPYSAVSTERTGNPADPGGAANNLTAGGSIGLIVPAPTFSKVIVATSQATTTGNNVAIGETIHYRLTLAVPEGTTPGAGITDSFPAGMALVSIDGISASGALSTTIAGGFAAALAGATIGAGGTSTSFDFGTITNTDRDNATTETIVIDYTVIVLNAAENQSGTTLTNSATFAASAGSTTTSAPATSVVEPVLRVVKTPSSTTGDAGGMAITFDIVVSHMSGSNADAFDVALADAVPTGYTIVAGSLSNPSGIAPTSLSVAGNLISATFTTIALGGTSTIRFRATLNGTTTPGQAVTNTATIAYTSLPGDVTTAESPYNSISTERTGSTGNPGGSANDYVASGSGTVTVNSNTIAGFAYVDANNNAVKNGGETAISGVAITLGGTDNLGNVVTASTTTSGTGAYTFAGLRPGAYTVSEAQPASHLDGKDAVGTPFGGSASTNDVFTGLAIPLGVNASGANYNFGEVRPASVSGTVFSDSNNDGAKAVGEAGIAGVTLALTGTDDLGNAVGATTTTSAAGTFSFASLRPGTYTIAEAQPSAYLDGKDSAGNTGGTLANDLVSGFTLAEGLARTGVTFGELLPASLSGAVYLDASNDGSKATGEPGIGGVGITLTGTDDLGNAVNVSATTSNGDYLFSNLRPGTYAIAENQPSGYLDAKDTVGTPGGTATNDLISGIVLHAGILGASNNFGELLPSSLAGFVFADANNDGTKTAGESGIGGVAVALTGTDDRNNAVSLGATTAADGSYGFTGLRPGTYGIAETQPSAYLDGKDSVGTAGGTGGNDATSTITLSQNVNATGYNFGELAPASLAGIVYADTNNDGINGAGEVGIAGAQVTLTGTDDLGGSISRSATTAADGSYVFANLRPGTHAIAEVQPAAYLDGTDRLGSLGGSATNDNAAAIVVGAGAVGTGYNFGELAPSSLAGLVYSDANNDGSKSAGEPGIAGAPVSLTGTDDRGSTVILSATTAADGSYSFVNLRPGTYTLTEAQPIGYLDGKDAVGTQGGTGSNDGVSAISLGVGVAGTGNNFGELAPASLSGIVYADANNDGIKQAGEAGISGVLVTLTGTDDLGSPVSFSATTLADGSYAFANLRPGTYAIAETQPGGYLDGKDAVGTQGGTNANDGVSAIALGAGVAGSGNNFGELPLASVAGAVYSDANDDGLKQAGEAGIGGATLALTGTDDLGNSVNRVATTAGDGSYSFGSLRPGTYAVAETQPAGFLDGIDAAGSLGGIAANDTISAIVVAAEIAGTGYNFGELAPGRISGVVYSDPNNDGSKAVGESEIAGVTIILSGTDDRGSNVNLSVATAADGSYSFGNLRPGLYAVTESQPAGFLDGKDALGDLGGAAANDRASAVTLNAGDAGSGYDFGELAPASLAGVVYLDANNDGSKALGEAGIAGASVHLTGTDDLGNALVLSTTTAADGSYLFANLRPGTYAIAQTQPAGYLDGEDAVGTQGGSGANDGVSAIVLNAGVAGTGNLFGELAPATFAGSVYSDANNDGARQPAESGIGGAIVSLTGTNDLGTAVSRGTTTGADGSYSFGNLRPGIYIVAEAQPAGFLDGKDAVGNLGGTLGNDQIAAIGIASGDSAVAYDFGEVAPASLSGFVYHDVNLSGARESGETGIAGATLTISGIDDLGNAVEITAATGPGGAYSVSNLRPGVYAIAESQPSRFLDGDETIGTQGGQSTSNDTFSAITLVPGRSGLGNNFGEVLPSSLSGLVFSDANNDGFKQVGESGIGGATLNLAGIEDRGNAVALATTTLADGSFEFANLRPGTYTISEIQPAGFLDGKDRLGSLGGLAANDSLSRIVLDQGLVGSAYTFGELAPASLSGFVYSDANNNGTQDEGESPISGASITLTGTDDLGNAVSLSATTGEDGSYLFANLRPGTYAATETQPSGYLDGKDAAGTAGGSLGNDVVGSIVLTTGRVDAGYNFGELLPTSLAGSVYEDTNNDGARQEGELGMAGATVLLTGTDDLGNAVRTIATTLADGSYGYANLRPGIYALTESQPAGFLDGKDAQGTPGNGTVGDDQIASIGLVAGVSGSGHVFGELRPSSISGMVFSDSNNDGIVGGAEAGIEGVAITLTGTDDLGQTVNLASATAENGSYQFANLRPGLYTVNETQAAGYLDGRDSLGNASGSLGNDVAADVTLVAGTNAVGYAFGEVAPSSLSGSIFRDLSDDGSRQAGEPGISGTSVTLSGTDDLGNAVQLTLVSQEDGSYSFGDLRPGTYAVAETQPSGYLDGTDAIGSQGGSTGDDVLSQITLVQGTDGIGNTFGELVPSSLAGSVFNDANDNGSFDESESGIAGVAITLTGTDDRGEAISVILTTADDGSFLFAYLRPGLYAVAESQPAAYLDGTDTIGTQGGTGANDRVSAIALADGTDGAGNHFGELLPASLSARVFEDRNNNGAQDEGESGIAGADATLIGIDDLGQPVSITIATGADGTVRFTNLRPGAYTLSEAQPVTFLDGIDSGGASGGVLSDDQVGSIPIVAGAEIGGITFAELVPSSLAGTVYRDANNDGTKQEDEPGIAGASITLSGTDDLGNDILRTIITAVDGTYSLANLRPGLYTLSESQPAGYLDGKDALGSEGGTLGNDLASAIMIAAGELGMNYNFGELAPASLSGLVFRDDNNDGTRQAGEPTIQGVAITLTGTDDLGNVANLTTSTAADGSYSFGNLRPGLYAIAESQPSAYFDGKDSAGNSGGTLANDRVSEILLSSSQDVSDVTFGELNDARLSGSVFEDRDNDGIRDVNEAGIGGVAVALSGIDDRGNVVGHTTTTAADGSYAFVGLRPGTYTLSESQPAGFLDGTDAAGTQGGSAGNDRLTGLILASNSHGTGNTFGELVAAKLSGSVYIDSNDDSVRQGGEPAIAGVSVRLSGTDDLGLTVDRTGTTAADGSFAFSGLRPGTYTVSEAQPTAFSDGRDARGTAGGVVGNDSVSVVTLAPGTSATGYTFGERGATLSGTVFIDTAADGAQVAGEPGMGGVTVTLLDDVGNVVATTTTATDGTYSFHDLAIGNYTIVETRPGQLGETTPTRIRVGVPASGLSGQDFGLAMGSLAGSVYIDSDNNDSRSGSEVGIAGVVVTLTGTETSGVLVSRTTTTTANGSYRFDGLLPGTYSLTESQPSALLDGGDRAGTLGGAVGNDRVGSISLAPGVIGAGYDFGELTPASLSGFAYLDLHRNRVFDPGDVGIAHVFITLAGTDDLGNATTLTTTTGDDGSYRFSNLRPGVYSVSEKQPPPFRDSADQVGSQGGTGGNDRMTNLILSAGVQGTNNNFGELPKPGCKLTVFVPYGINSVAYLNWRRALNPGRFDRYHPDLGPFLANGGNPAANVRLPKGAALRFWLPSVGTRKASGTVTAKGAKSASAMNRVIQRMGSAAESSTQQAGR